MNRLRAEFRGLRLTPLAEDLGLLAAGVGCAAGVWLFVVFIVWCAS